MLYILIMLYILKYLFPPQVSNYSQLLLDEAVKFISSNVSTSPFFLYWAPDSTHGPWYSSTSFHGSSARFRVHLEFLRFLCY